MQYKAKLIDQITERPESKEIFKECQDKEATLSISEDGHAYIYQGLYPFFRTSPLIADPVIKDGKITVATKNSIYVFELLS